MLPHVSNSSSCELRSVKRPDPQVGRLTTGPLILVVDDDSDVRDAVTDALELEGYSVVSAMHGAEALERLRERRPVLIIVDLMMPVMDGHTFITAKNRDPTIAQIPILVATAEPRVNVEGVTVFMRKPFDLDSFLASVARCASVAEKS